MKWAKKRGGTRKAPLSHVAIKISLKFKVKLLTLRQKGRKGKNEK
jgi:hypothetical protein